MVSVKPRLAFLAFIFTGVMIISCYGKVAISETDHQTELERVIDQDTIIKLIENVELQNGLIQKLQDRVDGLLTENVALTKRIEYLESRDKPMRAEQQEADSSRDSNSKISSKGTMNMRGKWFGLLKSKQTTAADVQRSKDVDESTDNVVGSDVTEGSDELPMGIQRRQTSEDIAFLARLDNHIHNQGDNQIVAFDNVITNNGNGYNANVGNFQAPVRGTYVFSATLMTYMDHTSDYYFSVNGVLISSLFLNGEASQLASSSNTVVLNLNAGDDVAVRHGNLEDDINASLHGNTYSSFCGFLLRAH